MSMQHSFLGPAPLFVVPTVLTCFQQRNIPLTPQFRAPSAFIGASVLSSRRPTFIQRRPLSVPLIASLAAPDSTNENAELASKSTLKISGRPNTITDPSIQSDLPSPSLSPGAARSALGTLVRYFKDLSAQQPFIARRLFLAILCVITSKFIGISVPFFFKLSIDHLMQHSASTASSPGMISSSFKMTNSVRFAIIAIVMHGIARIGASVSHELRNAVFSRAGQRIGRSITADSFAHLHSLELAFHTTSRTGALTRVVDRGTRSVMTLFRAIMFSFFPSFFELILVCAVLFTRFSRAYVAITLITFFAFTAWTLSINNEMSRMRAQLNSAENEASAKLTDSLINAEAVKVFDNERFETSRYDVSLKQYEDVATRSESLYARLNVGQTCVYTCGLTALLLLATRDIVLGKLTVGSVVLLSTMLQRLWIPLDFLGWQYREVKQSLIDVQNLFDILKRKSHITDVDDAKNLVVTEGSIEFDNVTFLYPSSDNSLPFSQKSPISSSSGQNGNGASHSNGGTREVHDNAESRMVGDSPAKRRRVAIDGLSFKVPAGSSVALVGASGSGKSTATRLLCRLYDVTDGRILMDGQDISKATMSSLRQADTALFNDTIAYNIRYGRLSATDEEVVAAAKAASIHDVIMRTELGYDTMVGERGVRLSGGERQRLSVARAFLKGSPIIIEDESTSALDTLTEMEVSKALQRLGRNRTRVIVAHRLSTIMNVDKIVVMKAGRKVEEGSFEELVGKRDGIFRNMWERQQRRKSGPEKNMEDESMLAVNDNGHAYTISTERQCDENAENEEAWHESADH